MERDFNQVINRKNTACEKYDFAKEHGKPEDILPLWVADMDFPAPKAVTERLVELVQDGIFGYTGITPSFREAVRGWYREWFDFQIEEEWMVQTPGVVYALATAIKAFTREGDSVMIQQPVYGPFARCIHATGRKLVNNPLHFENGRYTMDLEDMEKKIVEQEVKLFLLCSPHNPVGRVWSQEELEKAGNLCKKYGVKIVCDEIHSDFVYPEHKHTVFLNVQEDFKEFSMVCTAPSKTFNLAGLQVSNLVIADEKMREDFKSEVQKTGYDCLNMLGVAACEAAYRGGRTWLDELKVYLKGNLDFLREFLEKELPCIRLVEPEGTYLAWLDCSGLSMTDQERERFFAEKAKIWTSQGVDFGDGGEGFERLNLTCPRSVLEQALCQLRDAVNEYKK
ncbi:MAG: pyridoxal phosphate-dependent aminotransferase [Clostridiales bacterium]|nr:pyridoxal phosphate-dependent aminotransferase [Clostridiales bacterium]